MMIKYIYIYIYIYIKCARSLYDTCVKLRLLHMHFISHPALHAHVHMHTHVHNTHTHALYNLQSYNSSLVYVSPSLTYKNENKNTNILII